MTVADLKVFLWVRFLRSGNLDHVPSDLPERHAAGLVALANGVANDDRVSAYYAMRAAKNA
jgi:hypothetical protein